MNAMAMLKIVSTGNNPSAHAQKKGGECPENEILHSNQNK
jgi:hypothetical protein